MDEILIYIRVTGGDVECWAPAAAVQITGQIYRVTRAHTEDRLEFAVGDRVVVEDRGFPDGSEARVAVAAADAS